jgi:hypothetical protein
METEIQALKTYRVPEVNYPHLQEQIAKLQKRATKLGCGAIEMIEVGHEDWPGFWVTDDATGGDRIVYRKPGTDLPRPTGDYRRYFQIQVTGDRPKLNGWQFAATLDAIYDEDGKFVGNMLRVLPGFELPEIYRTADASCDHCRVQRNRKNTFIVKHEDGTWKQIGRQCLKDFLGHASPEMYARYAEMLMSLDELGSSSEDEDWLGGGSSFVRRYRVQDLLQITAMFVRADGWKSKVFEAESTASSLTGWLMASDDQRKSIAARYLRHQSFVLAVSDSDKQTATETMEWLEGLSEREGLNDYLHNLSLLGKAGAVEMKVFGFLASAIPAYLRTKNIETFRKQERLVSNYVGKPTERMETILTLKMKRYIEGDYGTRTMCKYHDETGNVVIWWASSSIDMEDGTKLKAKFTVKEHSEYEGIKQTIVSRLKELEILSTPQAA